MANCSKGRVNLTASQASTDEQLDRDTVFELLADPQRRAVIEYFANDENPKSVDFDCLAQYIFEREFGSDETVAKSTIRISLYHSHLPKLVAAGVLDFDREKKTISYQGSAVLERVLSASNEPG